MPMSPGRARPVLILAHSYPPVSHSGALRPARFAKYLGNSGRRVEVLTSTQFLDAPSSPGVHRIPRISKGAPARIFGRFVWLASAPVRAYDYGITWLLDSVRAAAGLVGQMGPCCVLSTFPPLSTHLTALRLKRRFRDQLKWVADFRDPIIGNPFRKSNALAAAVDRRLESDIVRSADAITVNTDVLGDELRERYPDCAPKIRVLWNGFDPEEELGPLPIPPRNYRVLAHVGTIYGGRHPGIVIDSLRRLEAEGFPCAANIRLVQIGSADFSQMPDPERIPRLVSEGKIELSGERVPREDALRAIAQADLLLLIDLNSEGDSTQLPAKVFDYVRSGRPILLVTSRESPADRIVQNCGIPHRIVYRDDTPARVDSELRGFLALGSEPASPSQWFLDRFDGARQAKELEELIDAL
jgi:glycosyltransferase involved in cell wall biosynthesis